MRILVAVPASLLSLAGNISFAFAASQTLVGSYYESFTSEKNCPSTTICIVNFPAIPPEKIILINRVMCRTAANTAPVYMFFGATSGAGSSIFIKRTYFESSSGVYFAPNYHLTFNSSPQILIGPGKFPTVLYQIGQNSPISLECSLGGVVVSG